MEQTKFIRQPAKKVEIKSILESEFIEDSEKSTNYILTKENEKIHRVNILSIIVHKEKVGTIINILLDDGTGKIILRSFEENKIVTETKIGDIILVVGKVRVYNQEKYLSYELIKKKNPLWLKVRALELERTKKEGNNLEVKIKEEIIDQKEKDINKNKKIETIKIKETIEEEIKEENKEKEDILLPIEKTTKLIKELDQGEGVLIEDIVEKSSLNDINKLIEKMLEHGDIFQNQPGRVKVL